jgi:hypothetical protein
MFINLSQPFDPPRSLLTIIRDGTFASDELLALRTAEPGDVVELMRLRGPDHLLCVPDVGPDGFDAGPDAYIWRGMQAIDRSAPRDGCKLDGETAHSLVADAHYHVVTAWMYPAA